jgi:phosphohistidine phosphatase
MMLYIVRHAYAGQHGDPRYPNDDARPLTKKGVKQFRRAVKRLSRRGFAPMLVATSPLVRCSQTAELICDRVWPAPELVRLDSLRPGSELESLVAWSNEQNIDELAWVGHAPDVDHLAAALLGARDDAIRFAKGAVAAMQFAEEIGPGEGQLQWFATPKSLGC